MASSHLNPDGTLRVVRWAYANGNNLTVKTGQRPFLMACSDATGEPLLTTGKFGCDIIRFAPGEGVGAHTHEGNHILLVLHGEGCVIWNDCRYQLSPGLAYLIEGKVVHAIEANSELILMAIGDDHRPVDSVERMTPVEVSR